MQETTETLKNNHEYTLSSRVAIAPGIVLPQKASGLSLLAGITNKTPPTLIFTKTPWAKSIESILYSIKKSTLGHPEPQIAYTWFIRPCPFMPNHGMKVSGLDSFKIKCKASKVALIIQVLLQKIEANEAIMLSMYVPATTSGVIGNEQVIIGKGHDGVTAGKGDTFYFNSLNYLLARPSFRIKEYTPKNTEIEFVSYSKRTEYTQLRKTKTYAKNNIKRKPTKTAQTGIVPSNNYVPQKAIVIKTLTDLSKITEETKPFLVIHLGGSLYSHACSHTRIQKGAYCSVSQETTSKEIEIIKKLFLNKKIHHAGNWIYTGKKQLSTQTRNQEKEYFIKGIYTAINTKGKTQNNKLGCFFHDYAGPKSMISDDKKLAFLAGGYVGEIIKTGASVILGELRHCTKNKLTHTHIPKKSLIGYHDARFAMKEIIKAIILDQKANNTNTLSRFDIFQIADKISLSIYELKQIFMIGSHLFNPLTIMWPPHFGGPNWQFASRILEELITRIIQKGSIEEIIKYANAIEHCSHNTNTFLSKRFDVTMMGFATDPTIDSHFHLEVATSVSRQAFKFLTLINNTPEKNKRRRITLQSVKKIIAIHKTKHPNTTTNLTHSLEAFACPGNLKDTNQDIQNMLKIKL